MFQTKYARTITLTTLILLAAACTTDAATWHVAVDAPEDGDGLTWQTAFNTIQAGIDAASDGDEVLIGDGTYTGEGNRDINFNGKAITVQSLNGPQKCLINCEGTEEENHRGFVFNLYEDENSILRGVTIFNGFHSEGGAVLVSQSSPIITNCIFSNNIAGSGGAIYCLYGTHALVCNSIMTANKAETGGAMYCYRSSPEITNCTIAANHAYWKGKAISLGHSSTHLKVSNSIIWGNTGGGAQQIDCRDETTSISFSNIEDGWDGEGNSDADPLFAFDGNDFHLLPGSPCINSGSNVLGDPGVEVDLDGNPRISGTIIDRGAYEYNLSEPASLAVSTSRIRIIDPYGTKQANTPLLNLRNRTTGTVSWSAQSDANWLILTPDSGESMGEIDSIQLTADPTGLPGGVYETEIMIRNAADSSPLAVIAVVFHIGSNRTVKADGSGEFPTIQSAINASIHGDRISCEPGTYTGDENWNIRFYGKAVHLKGTEGPERTIIDCNHTPEKIPFFITDNETTETIISDFTITGSIHPRGGVYCMYSSPSFYNCIIKGNKGRTGSNRPVRASSGGLSLFNASPQVVNSVICGNSSDWGAGISIARNSSPLFSHCAIVSNHSGYDEEGIENDSDATVTFNNCILWGNSSGNENLQIDEGLSANTVLNSCCIQGGWPGQNNIDQDPMFIRTPDDGGDGWADNSETPLINESVNNDYGDLRLRGDSPCINTGNGTLIPSDWFDMDQNGLIDEHLPWDMFRMPRIAGACPDMGPVEFNATPMLTCSETSIRLFAFPASGSRDKTITIRNSGSGTIDWKASSWSNWLSISRTKGKLQYETETITLTVNPEAMQSGDYWTTLTFTSRRAANSPLTIPVHLSVTPYRYRVEADGSGDFPTIQDAINAAVDGDLIICGDGTYTGTGNRNISFLGKRITLASENGPENCIIDCQGNENDLGRGFGFAHRETRDSILDGFTITNGFIVPHYFEHVEEYKGGAILCLESSPTIRNCIFRNNEAYTCGAISNSTASPLISNCSFEENNGRIIAIGNDTDSNPVITDCHFFRNNSRNTASYYGVICNTGGSHAIITKCLFEMNDGCEGASGIADLHASSIVSDCIFRANQTHCIYSERSTTTITNCLFQSNNSWYSASIESSNSTMKITNTTFADKPDHGRILILNTTDQDFQQPIITNCIFFNDQYPPGYSGINYSGSEPLITYSLLQNWPGEGNIDADPHFIRLPDDGGDGWMDDPDTDIDESANNDYGDLRLQPGSPCIDAGSNLQFPDDILTDLLGLPRFIDDPATTDTGQGTPPLIDMGAYEVQIPAKKRLIPQTNIQPAPASAVTNISIKKNIP